MRSSRWILGLGLLAFTAQPGLVLADEPAGGGVEEQLQIMQQQMRRMQDELRRTRDELNATKAQMATAPMAEPSKIDSFFKMIEIGGWVSGSYNHNFNNVDSNNLVFGNAGPGFSGAYPFHPSTDSFSFDQLWFEIEKPVTEESRAGFRADIVFGKTADILDNGLNNFLSGDNADLSIYQAYVQYLAPIGPGVQINFGKFATWLGAEVAQDNANFNITRGNVYNLLQPINHVGISATGGFGDALPGFEWGVAVMNETTAAVDTDLNSDKAYMWRLAWSNDMFGVSLAGLHGQSDPFYGTVGNDGGKENIYDVIVSFDPTDRFSSYVNFDWRTDRGAPGIPGAHGWGIAAAGRYAITERLGAALRGEFLNDNGRGILGAGGGSTMDLWGITGTVDYALTDGLTIKGELRYDEGNPQTFPDNTLFQSNATQGGGGIPGPFVGTRDNQLVAAFQVLYEF